MPPFAKREIKNSFINVTNRKTDFPDYSESIVEDCGVN